MARENCNHRLTFEAAENDVATAQNLLNFPLPADTTRVRIEVDAGSPITATLPSSDSDSGAGPAIEVDAEAETATLDDWSAENLDETESDDFECICGKDFPSQQGLHGHHAYCDEWHATRDDEESSNTVEHVCDECDETFDTNGSYANHCRWNHNDDTDEDDETEATIVDDVGPEMETPMEVSSTTPTDKLFDDGQDEIPTTSSKSFLNFPTLDELPELDIYLTPGSDMFNLAALLYRSDEHLRVREIYETLQGTEWATTYKSTSAQLSQLRGEGIVDKEDTYGGKWWLTQLGKQYVQATVYEADEYPLTVADELTGIKSPSTSRPLAHAD